MRNLKRVLSLSLALVMMLGMMILGASAAEATTVDFDDAAEITNNEAVDVLVALQVFEGDENGSFNPTQILTREQAATIICRMLLGPENAAKLSTNSSVFTDVAAGRWSAGYIAYCANLGIIAGYGDGNFGPEDQLTGVAFGKMLLVALGYDPDIQGYVGKNWATAIATDMIAAGIDVKGVSLDAPLSRDDASQMAFQTLTADMVYYNGGKGTNVTTPDGTTIVIGAGTVTPVSKFDSNYSGSATTDPGYGTQQFCEKYFSTLRNDGSYTDDFGRAAEYSWYLDKNENGVQDVTEAGIYDAVRTPVATFTSAVAAGKIVNTLKGYTFNGTKLVDANTTIGADTSAIGGLTFANTTDKIAAKVAGLTGDGKVVEVYATSKAVDDVVVVSYTKETITNVTTAANGDVTYVMSVSGSKIDKADGTDNDTVILHGDVTRGAIVTTVVGVGSGKLHVYPTTAVTGTMNAYSSTDGTVTVGGAVYTVADGVTGVNTGDFYTTSLLNKDVIVTLDQYGTAVAIKAVTASYDNYAQVKGSVVTLTTTVDGTTPAVQARFVLADGTVATYNVKVSYAGGAYKIGSDTVFTSADVAAGEATVQGLVDGYLASGTIFAYELDGTTIDLQAVATSSSTIGADIQGTSTTIVTGSTTAGTIDGKTVLLTGSTVYVLYNSTSKTSTVYTGSLPAGATLSSGAQVVATVNSNTSIATAQVVFGDASDVVATSTGNYAYVVTSDVTVVKIGNTAYDTYKGYAPDGTTITLYDKQSNKKVTGDGVYTWDEKNNVTGAYTGNGAVQATAVYNVVGDQIVDGSGNAYNIAGANIIYTKSNLTTVDGKYCVVVLARGNNGLTNNAATIFVVG